MGTISTQSMSDDPVPLNRANTRHTHASTETESDDTLGQPVRLTTTNALARTATNVITPREDEFLTRVLSRAPTNYSTPLPEMGDGKPLPPPVPKDRQIYRVEFDSEEDPTNPYNWSNGKKLWQAIVLAANTIIVTLGSASFSPATIGISEEFHVSRVVSVIGVTLYVMGFACGPVLWGPLSEQLGRKIPMVLGMFLFICFTFATGAAKDLQTIMLGRFFAGACGSNTLAVVPAAYADIYRVKARGVAVTIFAFVVFAGPELGPIVGGYICNSFLGWRWALYIIGIGSSAVTVLMLVCYEETFHPIILVAKAKELRERTGNWAIYAQQETVEVDFQQLIVGNLIRPLKMLCVEPILLLLTGYSGYVYGLLYALLSAIPIIYEGYGFKGGNVYLPYIGLFVGALVYVVVSVLIFEPRFHKVLARSGQPVCPEARLEPMMIGAVTFTIGIFWMCWTGAYPDDVHWIVPTIGAGFFGFGMLNIFQPIVGYLLDAYLLLAASAMSAKTFLRSIMGASFPLYTTQMFNNLGIQWAGTLLGCLSALLLPVPFIFYKYGAWIRSKSKYAINLDDIPEGEKVPGC